MFPRFRLLVLGVLAVLVACTGSPADPDRVVLRLETGPVAPVTYNEPPTLLFADGRLVTPAAVDNPVTGPAIRGFQVRQLTDEAVDEITDAAGKAGLNRSRSYPGPSGLPATVTSTTFRFNDGEVHEVQVDNLGRYFLGEPVAWEVRDGRLKILDFHERFTHIELWLPEAAVGRAEEFEFERMIVAAAELPAALGSPLGQPLEWPLGDLDRFGEVLVSPFQTGPAQPSGRCGVVDGEDLATVLETAGSARGGTPWSSNGKLYAVRFQPLLAGDAGCPAAPAP
ncbi:MAG TPA: hypothetical protein VHL54_05565 [Actinomycetota bacterium]|nr:hypothetical protein [Actinomycetota bacterium]